MSDIVKYLARVVPWPSATLSGFVNVHWPSKKVDAHGQSLMPGRAFQQQQTAAGFVSGMGRNNLDLYLCMSLQATSHPEQMVKGKKHRRAIRSKISAVALRSFFLDVDIKNGKFRDTTHALTEFGIWRRQIGLPVPSLIVLSGSGGFHAYWVLHEPIPLATWEPIAEALKTACQQGGFEADHKVTANAALILRIPGTFNQKHTPPRLAQIIHEGPDYALIDIETPLLTYKSTLRVSVTQPVVGPLGRPSAVFAGVPLPGRLDAGLDTYVPTIEEVAEECPFIKATMQNHGRLNWEPLWRESLRVAAFVQDGEEVAHELSDGHVSYAEADTDRKFAEVDGNKQRVGWPQCRSIHDAGALECKNCPHLPKSRSPLNFALPKAAVSIAAAAAIAFSPTQTPAAYTAATIGLPLSQQELPASYGQHKNGRIYKLMPDPNDPAAPAIPVDILPLPIANLHAVEKTDEGGNFGVGFDCEIMPGKVRSVQLTYSEITDLREMTKRMSQQGLAVEVLNVKLMKEFMVAFTQQLANAKRRIIDCKPHGWSFTKDGAFNGFCYAQHRWNGSTTAPVQPLDREVDELYTPRGDPQIWIDCARLITDQNRPELNAVIGASYGAPMVLFTGFNGSVLHLWSPDSGTGKSTALHVAQAVWGTTAKMSKIADTPNAVNNKLGQLRNLPVLYDELKKVNDKKLVDLVMQVGLGATKERLNRASQAMPVYTWHTLMIAGSNSSLHGYISEHDSATVAGINRVFEYRVHENTQRTGMIEHTKAQRMLGDLQTNYGHAGLAYAKFLGSNYDLVRDSVARTQDAVNNAIRGTTDDRFWIAMVAVILCGAKFANHLQHTTIDLDQLAGFLTEQLLEQRGDRKKSANNLIEPDAVERLIGDFIGAHRERMLITERIWRQKGHPPSTWNPGKRNEFDLKGNVVIRAASQDGCLRIGLSALAGWAKKERDLGRSEILNAVKDTLPSAKLIRAELGHGTGIKIPRQDVIEIDLNQMPGFFNFD